MQCVSVELLVVRYPFLVSSSKQDSAHVYVSKHQVATPGCEGGLKRSTCVREKMEKTAKVLGEVLSEDPFAHCPAPELCTQVGSDDADIILLGLALSFAAGLATTGGALLAFLPCIEVG